MNHSDNCTRLVKQFEGCVLKAYPDPGSGGDPWTIGYGHTGPEVKRGLVWTQAQADAALQSDLAHFDHGVSALLGSSPATQGQFDALVSFAFNVGLGNLKNSTLLRKHIAHDYDGAAGQFARWNKASGRVMNGLVKRRTAEARVYRGLPI
jgi:lysozyme